MSTTTSTPTPSLSKGLLAGLIGGIAGAAVILVAEEIFPPNPRAEPSPLPAFPGGEQTAPPATTAPGYPAIRWAFRAAAGGLYGIAAEWEPSLTAWRGAAFGITLNRLTHESLLPRLGLAPSKEEQSTQARVSSWISHAAYGIATESVRRVLRRIL